MPSERSSVEEVICRSQYFWQWLYVKRVSDKPLCPPPHTLSLHLQKMRLLLVSPRGIVRPRDKWQELTSVDMNAVFALLAISRKGRPPLRSASRPLKSMKSGKRLEEVIVTGEYEIGDEDGGQWCRADGGDRKFSLCVNFELVSRLCNTVMKTLSEIFSWE